MIRNHPEWAKANAFAHSGRHHISSFATWGYAQVVVKTPSGFSNRKSVKVKLTMDIKLNQ